MEHRLRGRVEGSEQVKTIILMGLVNLYDAWSFIYSFGRSIGGGRDE
jgi:hypothetical protein